jgi:signal transduction histidine kinase
MKAIERVVVKTRKLQNLINSLLFVSTNQNGNVKYNFEQIDLVSILNGVLNISADSINEKNLSIMTDLAFDSCLIDGDRTYLPQVFHNLIDNAIKFTPKEGNITIFASVEENKVNIVIGDTGIGIAENDIPALFTKFYQIDSSSTRNYGGNGLGLYISKVIVESHNGKIWIESEEGTGTDVHISLPIKQKNQFSASSRSSSLSAEKPVLK